MNLNSTKFILKLPVLMSNKKSYSYSNKKYDAINQ